MARWQLDGIRFVVPEQSKRPAMAFVSFTRDIPPDAASDTGGERPTPHVIAAEDNEVE